jgi:hypothetical protein
MAGQQRRPKKADLLNERLAASSGTLKDLQSIAVSLNLMEDRYMARPAAELMVTRGDPGAEQIAAGLAATPVLGRDPNGDRLRAAFKQALANEGIPPRVEAMARKFYERRGRSGSAARTVGDTAVGTNVAIGTSGGIFNLIRRLFGGGQ